MKLFWLVNLIVIFGFSIISAKAEIYPDKKADITVAADGSGDVKTVGEAVAKVPENNQKRFVIFIKPGVYREQIKISASKPFVSFVGEKAETTKLTFNLTNKVAGSTSASYSVYIGGHDFYAENVTFENSFGQGSQAVAVLAEADRVVFKNCLFSAGKTRSTPKTADSFTGIATSKARSISSSVKWRRFLKTAKFTAKATVISLLRCDFQPPSRAVSFSSNQN